MPRSKRSRASATGRAKSARGQARAATNRIRTTGKPTTMGGVSSTSSAKRYTAKRRRRY